MPSTSRRKALKYLGSWLSLGYLSIASPEETSSSADVSESDFTALTNIDDQVIRLAQRQIQRSDIQQDTVWVVQAYLREPDSTISNERLEHRIHHDIVIGRTSILDGWVISETELVLLASVNTL